MLKIIKKSVKLLTKKIINNNNNSNNNNNNIGTDIPIYIWIVKPKQKGLR